MIMIMKWLSSSYEDVAICKHPGLPSNHTQKSRIEYHQVLDAKAESKDAMTALIDELYMH